MAEFERGAGDGPPEDIHVGRASNAEPGPSTRPATGQRDEAPRAERTIRPRRWHPPLLALAMLVIACGGAWLVAGRTMLDIAAQVYFAFETRRGLALAPGDDPTPVTFVVDEGDTLSAVARRLEDDGLIRSARLLLVYHKCIAGYGCNDDEGANHFIQAGAHELRRTMTMQQVYNALLVAENEDVTVTLLEGLRAEEVADVLSGAGLVDRSDFLTLVTDPPPATAATSDTITMAVPPIVAARTGRSLEGYLFPDTYRFDPRAGTRVTIEKLLATFAQKAPADLEARAQAIGLSGGAEAVTLASIVQREGVRPDELPKIARVYLNRLASPPFILNADPTLQYALGLQPDPPPGTWWKRPLYDADKQVDSPYNSYLRAGLPPGPIASPGLVAIQAVLAPADGPWMYFVASAACDGTHAFAVTYEEHLANVARYTAAGCGP